MHGPLLTAINHRLEPRSALQEKHFLWRRKSTHNVASHSGRHADPAQPGNALVTDHQRLAGFRVYRLHCLADQHVAGFSMQTDFIEAGKPRPILQEYRPQRCKRAARAPVSRVDLT